MYKNAAQGMWRRIYFLLGEGSLLRSGHSEILLRVIEKL